MLLRLYVPYSPWTYSLLLAILFVLIGESLKMEKDGACQSFGVRLRNLRMESGVSQEQLAELASLDRTYISSVERGKRNISLINILKLAEALHLPPSSLLDFSVNEDQEE